MDARLATTDERTAAALKTAHRQRLAKFAWQLGGIGAALVAMVTGLVSVGANALFDFGLTGGGVALAFTLLPMLAAVVFFAAGKRADKRSASEVEAAWDMATARLFQASGGQVDSAQLAELFGVDHEQATEMLARAEVDQLLAPGAPAPRVRVADSSHSSASDTVNSLSDEQQAERELEESLGHAPTEEFRVNKPG